MSALSFPVVFVALVWLRLKAQGGRRWRAGLLEAALLLGAGTVLCTELLGGVHVLRPVWISLVWVFAGAIALGYLWREFRQPSPVRRRLRARLKGISLSSVLGVWHPLELAALGLALVATGLIAWLSPPTNYDSMTYQLARIMHWFQQGSLEHYPTSNVRQLAYGPGAAYWQVQLWSVFNGDLGANLPQWAALVGCAVALTLWLQRFVDRRAIGLAVIAGLTLPMALLQACSTQTDLQVGCWLLIAAVFLSDPGRASWAGEGFCGLAIGLAVATKPSAVLCLAPLAVVAVWRIGRENGFASAARAGLTWIAVSLAICLPHFSRNFRWFGKPLGNDFGTVVESLSPSLAAANAARWIALNLPVMKLWRGIAAMLASVGLDPNHPAITFSYARFAPASPYVVYRLLLPDEDFACYTGIILLTGLLALVANRLRRAPDSAPPGPRLQSVAPWLTALFVALVLQFVLLKWQWWGNRLLLPWALLSFPLLVGLTGVWRHRRLRAWASAWLIFQTAFVLIFCLNRPLVTLPKAWNFVGAIPLFAGSRTQRFYAGYNAEALPVCRQLIAAVKKQQVRRVGLLVDENYPEYVLWRALHDAGLDHVEIYHLNASLPPGVSAVSWPPRVDLTINVLPQIKP